MHRTMWKYRRGLGAATFISMVVLVAASSPALSHHPSGITSAASGGPIITIPATTLQKGASAAFVTFQYVAFDELSDSVLEVAAEREEDVHSLRSTETPSLGLAYGITDRLMVFAQLPDVAQTNIREGEHHHTGAGTDNEIVNLGDSLSVGDFTLLAQYRFFGESSGLQAAVLAGVQAPTGKTDERDSEGELFETEFQPGSGSWDGLFGLALSKPLGKWSLDANVLYILVNEGAQQTDLGDRFQYNGSVSYRLTGEPGEGAHEDGHAHNEAHHHDHHSATQAVDLMLEVNGEWQAEENIAGLTDPNSGGNVVYISPGLRLISSQVSGFVSVGVPIVNDLNGIQSDPTYRIVGGLVVSFE